MSDYSVLDTLREGVQIIDEQMRYVYLNKALLKQIGMSADEIVGKPMNDKFPGIDQTEIYREIIRCRSQARPQQVLNEFTFPDGRRTYHELSLQPLENNVIIFSRDVTDSKKGELLLIESNKSLEQFAHLATHDLREPVRRVTGLSEELLLDFAPSLPPHAQDLCRDIHEQIKSLMGFINDFRHLSGLGGARLIKSRFDLVALAQELQAEIAASPFAPQLKVIWPEQQGEVLGYRSLVELLLRNLLSNAYRYGQDELQFGIDASPEGPLFTLSNRCKEPPPQNDLFAPLGSEQPHQTGLGLTIVRKVVDYHEGKVWSDYQNQTFSVHFSLQPSAGKST